MREHCTAHPSVAAPHRTLSTKFVRAIRFNLNVGCLYSTLKTLVGPLFSSRALSVLDEIHTRPLSVRKRRGPHHLITIWGAAIVLTPCRFLSIPEQVGTADMVMVPLRGTAQRGEVAFRPIHADYHARVSFLVFDPLHLEPCMQIVPRQNCINFTVTRYVRFSLRSEGPC